LISVPESLLNEVDSFLESERDGNRSEFIRLAIASFFKECKQQQIIEELKFGYKAMGAVNSELAESAIVAEEEALLEYESFLRRNAQ